VADRDFFCVVSWLVTWLEKYPPLLHEFWSCRLVHFGQPDVFPVFRRIGHDLGARAIVQLANALESNYTLTALYLSGALLTAVL
jgi:hypothetical protein